MKCWKNPLIFALVLLGARFAWPQDPSPTPSPTPTPSPSPAPQEGTDFEAVIADLKGVVDVKRPEDAEWVAAAKNMKLGKGSEICTGASSTATLVVGQGLVIELKPVTMASLVALVKRARLTQVDANLKFGSADIKLEKTEVRRDMQVATPAVTTSISGSHGLCRAWASLGERALSLRIFEGKWGRVVRALGVEQTGGPGDALNDLGDLASDLEYELLALLRLMNDASKDDLPNYPEFSWNNGKWYEFGSPQTNPKSEKPPTVLPGPPGPP